MAVTSCGVLVLNPCGELLLGHATGAPHWDIPKGVCEAGESPRDTAVREAAEETGLQLAAETLIDLGRFKYRPGKDLQLYATLIERVDPVTFRCTSLFRDARGRMRPEFDTFQWAPFDRVPALCAKSMAAVLTGPVLLPRLLERLA